MRGLLLRSQTNPVFLFAARALVRPPQRSGCATKAQSYLLVTFPLSASAAVTYMGTTASALNVSQSIAKYADVLSSFG